MAMCKFQGEVDNMERFLGRIWRSSLGDNCDLIVDDTTDLRERCEKMANQSSVGKVN